MIHSTEYTTLTTQFTSILTEGMNQSARTLLNCTAMDIMYYTSPLFRMEIWSALQYELNRLYQMFTARNPTFEANGGKVSIVTHSLGNISSYDNLLFPNWASLALQAVLSPTTCCAAGAKTWSTPGAPARSPDRPALLVAGDISPTPPSLRSLPSAASCSE